MCDITIIFDSWETDEIILKLAEYIKDGFTLTNYSVEWVGCCDKKVTCGLVKCKK